MNMLQKRLNSVFQTVVSFIVVVVFLTVWTLNLAEAGDEQLDDDTALARTARSMKAGEFKKLPVDRKLTDLDLHYHLITWADTGVWNPVKQTVQWIGGPGSCCADRPKFRLLSYDAKTKKWSMYQTPWETKGHAYDANALDPKTGVHYFERGGNIQGYDGKEWNKIPEAPIDNKVANAMTWFEAYNNGKGGLVYVAAGLAIYDGEKWKEIDRSNVEWGYWHMFAESNPVHDVVWLGGGNKAEHKSARMNTDLELTQLDRAPVSLNSHSSEKTYDPVTGNYIVLRKKKKKPALWYEYNIMKDQWKDISKSMNDAIPLEKPGRIRFATPINNYGVILYTTEEKGSYLYKHAESK